MTSERLNVSVSEEHFKFLEENPALSPSKLLQNKLDELIDFQKYGKERLNDVENQLKRVVKHRDKFNAFVQSKKLGEEFLNFEFE